MDIYSSIGIMIMSFAWTVCLGLVIGVGALILVELKQIIDTMKR